MVPKKLTPLKLEDTGNRLLFWDSTYTTPHLKPEFNGNIIPDCVISGERNEQGTEQLNDRLTLSPLSLVFCCCLGAERNVSCLSTGVSPRDTTG